MKRKSAIGICGKGFSFSQNKKSMLVTAVLFGGMISAAMAQGGDGSAGITSAEQQVKGYFDVGTQLVYGIGAVAGLIGAVKVYNKWNQGDQDTSKVAASWFGSCIFLVVVATVLRAFFLT